MTMRQCDDETLAPPVVEARAPCRPAAHRSVWPENAHFLVYVLAHSGASLPWQSAATSATNAARSLPAC